MDGLLEVYRELLPLAPSGFEWTPVTQHEFRLLRSDGKMFCWYALVDFAYREGVMRFINGSTGILNDYESQTAVLLLADPELKQRLVELLREVKTNV